MWHQGYTMIKFKNAQGVNNFSASNCQGENNVTILDQMPNIIIILIPAFGSTKDTGNSIH